jgi:hypothetical protein
VRSEVKNKALTYLFSIVAILYLQVSAADDFLDQLNLEASSSPDSKKSNTKKTAPPDIQSKPENKTEKEQDFLNLLDSAADSNYGSKKNNEEKKVTKKTITPGTRTKTRTETKDDFSNLINSEAGSGSDTKNDSKEQTVTKKTSTSNSSFIPKNKTKEDYDIYLKDNFPETYLDYIKLSDHKQDFIYTKYVKQSFPRIEEAQEIIKRFLKK